MVHPFQCLLRLIIAQMLCLSCCAYAKSTLLILGDSLSSAYQIPPETGWVALLDEKLKKEQHDITVINASIPGDTTANALARLPKLLTEYQPFLVIVELGGNDGLRAQPLVKMERNLDEIIKMSRDANAKVLLLGMRLPPNYGARYTQAFAEIYASLAKSHDIALVPFFLQDVGGTLTRMQPDRIHPTQSAQPILLDNVWPHLEPLLK